MRAAGCSQIQQFLPLSAASPRRHLGGAVGGTRAVSAVQGKKGRLGTVTFGSDKVILSLHLAHGKEGSCFPPASTALGL